MSWIPLLAPPPLTLSHAPRLVVDFAVRLAPPTRRHGNIGAVTIRIECWDIVSYNFNKGAS